MMPTPPETIRHGQPRPRCVVLAGPNGAGKSTHADAIVAQLHRIPRFINTDTIAAGIGGGAMRGADFEAGRIALRTIAGCISRRDDFAFETTLSGRRWPALLQTLEATGYDCLLHYLWIPDVAQCVERVRRRVRAGGHAVHHHDIRRRHAASLVNVRQHFLSRVTRWHVYDASLSSGLVLVAHGGDTTATRIADRERWQQFTQAAPPMRLRETMPHYRPSNADDTMTNAPDPTATATEGATTPDVNLGRQDRGPLMPSPEAVVAASRIAVRRALAIQRALGIGAAVMRDGAPVIVPPHELPLEANDPATFGEDDVP